MTLQEGFSAGRGLGMRRRGGCGKFALKVCCETHEPTTVRPAVCPDNARLPFPLALSPSLHLHETMADDLTSCTALLVALEKAGVPADHQRAAQDALQ